MPSSADTVAWWLAHWGLEADGAPFVTSFGSQLAPVRRAGVAAMLKIAAHAEERDGAALMAWWDGDGAAQVLAREGDAVLLERAMGASSLAAMARAGRDDAASLIICQVAAKLHAPRSRPTPPDLRPLDQWFRALAPAAESHGEILLDCLQASRRLLATPRDASVLHGDLHHDNVLDFGARGWLAIDPKGLIGERAFDYANLFCNPWPEADDRDRFETRLAQVAALAAIDPARLRQWILAYAGLSAAWTLESDMPADGPWRALKIARFALG